MTGLIPHENVELALIVASKVQRRQSIGTSLPGTAELWGGFQPYALTFMDIWFDGRRQVQGSAGERRLPNCRVWLQDSL